MQQSDQAFVDDRNMPYGWSWDKEAKRFDLPGLTTTEALTLVLAERHLNCRSSDLI